MTDLARCVLAAEILSNPDQPMDLICLLRQVPIDYMPKMLSEVNWAIITHNCMDYCDSYTIQAIEETTPHSVYLAIEKIRRQLRNRSFAGKSILVATIDWIELESKLKVQAEPGAQTPILLSQNNQQRAVGDQLACHGKQSWIARDTNVGEELLQSVKELQLAHIARLPVNKSNVCRSSLELQDNVSCCEAVELAIINGMEQDVSVYPDSSEANSSFANEAQGLLRTCRWPFKLKMKAEAMDL